MSRRGWALSAVAALAIVAAPTAHADPDQQPFVPGTVVDCAGQAVPLDPRVSVRDPLGTLIFQEMLKAMCGAVPPAPPAPVAPAGAP